MLVMINRIFLAIILLLTFTTPAHSYTVTSGHPRIHFTASDVSELNTNAASIAAYSTIKSWCETNWGSLSTLDSFIASGDKTVDYGGMRLALIYALGPVSGYSYTDPNHSIAEFGARAVDAIMNRIGQSAPVGAEAGSVAGYVATAVDWVWPLLSSAQKTSIWNWFKSFAGTTMTFGGQMDPYFNYRAAQTPKCLYPGLVFYGEGIDDSTATDYVDFVFNSYLGEALRCQFHQAGEDGGHQAGPVYAKNYYPAYYKYHLDFRALISATDETLSSLWGDYSFVEGYPNWYLNVMLPGPPSTTKWGSDAVAVQKWYDTNVPYLWNVRNTESAFALVLRAMARSEYDKGDTSKANWITWMIETAFGIDTATTFDVLWRHPSITASSPTAEDVPTVNNFGWKQTLSTPSRGGEIDTYDGKKAGLGEIYMRSAWTGIGTASDVTFAAFKAQPFHYFGHSHNDTLSWSIRKGQELAIATANQYYTEYEHDFKLDCEGRTAPPCFSPGSPPHYMIYKRNIATNTLLIMDPNEDIIPIPLQWGDGGENSYVDGGQRHTSDSTGSWGQVADDVVTYEKGGLIAHVDTDDFTYTSADATKAYNSAGFLSTGASAKVTQVERDFIYLKSNAAGDYDYFVIMDRINAVNPAFEKVFVVHTVPEPTSDDGSWTSVYGDGSAGLWSSTDTLQLSFTGTDGKLFMQTVLPASGTTVYKMGGEVTTTLSAALNNTDGRTMEGAKTNISVTDSSSFSDKPIVAIYDGVYAGYNDWIEAFKCDGKNDGTNTLTDCMGGLRIWNKNFAATFAGNETVKETFNWGYREGTTDDWVFWPVEFGWSNEHIGSSLYIHDPHPDEFGNWTIRVETSGTAFQNFLHVLHPTADTLKASMGTVTQIVPTQPTRTGVLIDDSNNRWVAILSTDGNEISTLQYVAGFTGAAKHFIQNLEDGYYWIYQDSTKIDASPTTEGTISFSSTNGGTFDIIKHNYVVNDFDYWVQPVGTEDTSNYPLSNVARPAKGVAYTDPNFYQTVTRITDSPTDLSGVTYDYTTAGYYKADPENADQTYLIIESYITDSPRWHVFNADSPWGLVKSIPAAMYDGGTYAPDIRWDCTDPDLLYIHKGAKFYSWRVSTEVATELYDFATDGVEGTSSWAAANYIGMRNEGMPSSDCRYWAFTVATGTSKTTQLALAVYDKTLDQVISSLEIGDGTWSYCYPECTFAEGVWIHSRTADTTLVYDWVGMSPNGDYVVTGSPPIWVYPRDLSSTRVLDTAGHVTIALDEDGNQVVVDSHYSGAPAVPDGLPTGADAGWMRMKDITDGTATWLAPVGESGDYPSCLAIEKPGWCTYTNYLNYDYTDTADDWSESGILVVKLTRDHYPNPGPTNHAPVWFVAHTHESTNWYYDKPQGKMNRDGTRIYFNSGWHTWTEDHNNPSGLIDTAEQQHDLYMVELPSDWENQLDGPTIESIPTKFRGVKTSGGIRKK